MEDMRERPIINQAQKDVWTDPATYPCRVILQRGGFKGGARLRLMITAAKGPHEIVNTDKGQTPTGPFSRVAVCGQRVIGSGVRAIIPGTQQRVSSDIRACANQCLTNLDINLQAAGSNIRKAYSMVVYLHNMNDVPTVMNVLYSWGLSESKMQLQFEYVDALNEYHDIEIAANAYL